MTVDQFSNASISDLLRKVAAAYEIAGEDRFRIRAYQNAATSVEHLTSSVLDLCKEGKLTSISGVGPAIAGHLEEYITTGKSKHFDQVLGEMPKGLFELFGIQGIGAKTAYKLVNGLKLDKKGDILAQVVEAARSGKIRALEGFGEIKEREILEAIESLKPNKQTQKRLLLAEATEIAEEYKAFMLKLDSVIEIEALGSLRRRVSTVGDLDFAVKTDKPTEVISHFVSYSRVKEVLNQGDIKASVLLHNNLRVDLMTETSQAFGSLLQHFTGSKAHNIALRKFALDQGKSLSEHGIKVGSKLHTFESEKEFYAFLDLDLVQPELREDKGEIQLAKNHNLPKLVEVKELKGDFHTHTNHSDGRNSLIEMVEAAKQLGYEYIGITDHAPSVAARGMEEVVRLVKERRKEIEDINNSDHSIRVLYGYEVNILSDATISLPDNILSMLDYAIGSIHTSFNQPKDQITKRLINAIRNPHILFIAHPTGRLINSRNQYEADWTVVFEEMAKHKKFLEINAQPERLDLVEDLVRDARACGVRFVVNSDAHSIDELKHLRYGIDVARRGWCERSDIINTNPLSEILNLLAERHN